jgi:hypothetical protein
MKKSIRLIAGEYNWGALSLRRKIINIRSVRNTKKRDTGKRIKRLESIPAINRSVNLITG